MSEIWSIVLTDIGMGACAHSPDTAHRQFSWRWPFFREFGVPSVHPFEIRHLLSEALVALLEQNDAPPAAIALSTPHRETAFFVDSTGIPVSSIYFDLPLTIPRHEIPERYASSPDTARVYRQSILRRIRQIRPDFCLNERPGLSTLGAFAAFLLTGRAADSCAPLGMPRPLMEAGAEMRSALYEAFGTDPELNPERARTGHVFARLSPARLESPQRFQKLAGVPIFHTGASESARAYASAADPLSWSAAIGFGSRVQWTAGPHACAAYEISVNPAPDADETPKDDLTRDEWTLAWHRRYPLVRAPGPRAGLASYGWRTPGIRSEIIERTLDALPSDGGHLDFDALRTAPLGSAGLHILNVPDGLRIVGLQSGHTGAHIARALFESLIYDIRSMRTGTHAASAPLRLVLDPPWPPECAQWAADIIAAPVLRIDASSIEHAAIGSAIALMRDLEIPCTSPSVHADVIEPSSGAELYPAHFAIHRALRDEL